ncbi:MAG: AAA family ATPase [Methylobacter sp.]
MKSVPHFKIDDSGIFTGFGYDAANDSSQSDGGLNWISGDDAADSAVAPVYMINGILETDSHGMLYGQSMSFKTFLALSLAFSICTGKKFFKHEVFKTGKVLYICGEGKGGLSRRLKALKIVHGGFNENFFILENSISIDNRVDMAKIENAIKNIQPILVIFDTFSSLSSDTDENSNSDVSSLLKLIKETCNKNGTTSSMTIHHDGKNSDAGMRGASAFKNDIDYLFTVKRANTETMITTISNEKQKEGELFAPFCIKAVKVALGLTRQDGTDTTSLVLIDTDETAPAKSDKGKSLDPNDLEILKALKTAIKEKGFLPTDEVIKYCDDNQLPHPKNIINLNIFRDYGYPLLNVTQDSKRTVLPNRVKKLMSHGKCLFDNGYIWVCE